METIWKELLEYARWSPSPHNIQPWKLKVISETEAQLYYDPIRLLPVEDYTSQFTISTFGLFIEYLSISASVHGLEVTSEYNNTLLDATKTGLQLFANLKLVKRVTPEGLDRELIKKRQTSRLPYDNKKILDPAVIQKLQLIAAEYGHIFKVNSDPKTVDWVLKLNCDTLFNDMDDLETRKEVGSWIRYSEKEASTKADGLWTYCLNIPSTFMALAFKKHWIMNLPVINGLLKSRYLQTTKGTKNIALFSGPYKNPADWINAGHMLGRFWLVMTENNLYLHPFGSIVTNKKSHARFIKFFNVTEQKNPLWLLVRLGYSDPPPRSYRLTTEKLLIK